MNLDDFLNSRHDNHDYNNGQDNSGQKKSLYERKRRKGKDARYVSRYDDFIGLTPVNLSDFHPDGQANKPSAQPVSKRKKISVFFDTLKRQTARLAKPAMAGMMLAGSYLGLQKVPDSNRTIESIKNNITDVTKNTYAEIKKEATSYFSETSPDSLNMDDFDRVDTLEVDDWYPDHMPPTEEDPHPKSLCAQWNDRYITPSLKTFIGSMEGKDDYSKSPFDTYMKNEPTFGRYDFTTREMVHMGILIPTKDNPDSLSLKQPEEWRDQDPKSRYISLPYYITDEKDTVRSSFAHYTWPEDMNIDNLNDFLHTPHGAFIQDAMMNTLWDNNNYFLKKEGANDYVGRLYQTQYITAEYEMPYSSPVIYTVQQPLVVTETGLQLVAREYGAHYTAKLAENGFQADEDLPKEMNKNMDKIIPLMVSGADYEACSHDELLADHPLYDKTTMIAHKDPLPNFLNMTNTPFDMARHEILSPDSDTKRHEIQNAPFKSNHAIK